jgi:hypothetical protein
MPAGPAPKSGWSFRRKALTAGAAGILALGVWLGTLFDGFGFGTGFGLGQSGDGVGQSGDGDGQGDSASEVSTEGVSADLGNPSTIRAANTGTSTAVPAGQTLDVLITGDGYELAKDPAVEAGTLTPPLSQHFEPAMLDDVVARAQATTGNASGIRVVVYRHKSATVGLQGTLEHALQDAGIASGGIHVVPTYAD